MSYPLRQTPVPVWAAPDRQPLQVDLEALPHYLFTEDVVKPPRAVALAGNSPPSSHGGWWNAVANSTQRPERSDVDSSLLTAYDLDKKWENRMDDDVASTNAIINLDKIRERFVKGLASNPFFPIALRGSASVFAAIALGLAAAVYVQTRQIDESAPAAVSQSGAHTPTASTIFTIVMSTISFVYLLYSLWDEAFGQPLGLRRPQSKINFMMLDLALLCLNSASLALAFSSMTNRAFICPALQNPRICRLHEAVVAFVLVMLVTWFFTFLVSTFRMIDRAAH